MQSVFIPTGEDDLKSLRLGNKPEYIASHFHYSKRYGVLCNSILAGPLNTTSVKSRAEHPASQDVSAALNHWGDAELSSNSIRARHNTCSLANSGDSHRGWRAHTHTCVKVFSIGGIYAQSLFDVASV